MSRVVGVILALLVPVGLIAILLFADGRDARADEGALDAVAELEAALPAAANVTVFYPYPGAPSYFTVTIGNGGILGVPAEHEGWCIDTDHWVAENYTYSASVYSSYEALPAGLIEHPENLDLVNWIANEDFVGQAAGTTLGTYSYGDVQRAIWSLVDDEESAVMLDEWSPDRVSRILTLAASHEGFVPGCGQELAVILAPVSPDSQPRQVVIVELDIWCESGVGDRVWEDLDGDGQQDGGEAGLDGVTVQLQGASGALLGATVQDGHYQFTDLTAGTYSVCVMTTTLPSDFVPTHDRDGLATPNCTRVSLAPGETIGDVDFGYQQSLSPTSTPSPSVSETATGTPTATTTRTVTGTMTGTPTATATTGSGATATSTATGVATASGTPTATATTGSGGVPTATGTSSATRTPTMTGTATTTATKTTGEPSSTATATPTVSVLRYKVFLPCVSNQFEATGW